MLWLGVLCPRRRLETLQRWVEMTEKVWRMRIECRRTGLRLCSTSWEVGEGRRSASAHNEVLSAKRLLPTVVVRNVF